MAIVVIAIALTPGLAINIAGLLPFICDLMNTTFPPNWAHTGRQQMMV